MPKDAPAVLDQPVTQSALLEALKFVIAEVGLSRASTLSADQLDSVLQKQAARENRSNAAYPAISPYSYPEGDLARPKPPLAREMWLNNARLTIDQLTPFEVLALNALSESLPMASAERTTRQGKWKVKTSQDNTKLLILIPCQTIEDKAEVNASSIGMLCQELAEGKDAVTAESMFLRMTRLEDEIARLRAGQPAASASA